MRDIGFYILNFRFFISIGKSFLEGISSRFEGIISSLGNHF